MKISQTPVPTRLRIACRRPSQLVEIADDGDAPRVRRPDREMHAVDRLRARWRAHPVRRRAWRASLRRSASRRAGRARDRTHTGRRRSTCPRRSAARSRYAVRRGIAPSKNPPSCRRASGASVAPSRVTTSTDSAPGTNARTTTAPSVSWMPSTANGSSCRPSTIASMVAAGTVPTAWLPAHGTARAPGGSSKARFRAPDFLGVIQDRAIGGEPAHPRRVERRRCATTRSCPATARSRRAAPSGRPRNRP